MSILTILYVAAVVLLMFGAAIFVHEFGHYWVARRRGMKVEAFAIGFGPKLFGWKKDGIDYAWRLIPAGGYVKLPQMVTSEMIEGTNAGEPLPPASPMDKILVAVAGPFMNLVFAFAIAAVIYFVGLPVLVNPSFVGYVAPDSPEYALGIREGDRIVEVNGEKVKSWHEVQMATVLARTNVIPVVIERANGRQTYHLKAEQNELVGGKFLNLDPRDHPEIQALTPDSAAEAAGLKAKDVIMSFDGVPIMSREQFIKLVQKRAGEPTEIKVNRGSEKLTFTVAPKKDPTTGRGFLGVMLGSSVNHYEIQRPGPTPWANVYDVWKKTIDTLSALFHSKETGVGAKDLSGPVGILALLAHQVLTDYRLALNFLVLLNINLAILNMLPIPVLDGGHIIMSIIEKIRRKPLHPRIVEYATTGFALALISFMLYVSFHDVKRLPLFRAMFKQESHIEEKSSGPNDPNENAPAPPKLEQAPTP